MATPMNSRLALEQLRRWLFQGVVPIKYHPYGKNSVIIELSDDRKISFVFPDKGEFKEAKEFIRILIKDSYTEYDRQAQAVGA